MGCGASHVAPLDAASSPGADGLSALERVKRARAEQAALIAQRRRMAPAERAAVDAHPGGWADLYVFLVHYDDLWAHYMAGSELSVMTAHELELLVADAYTALRNRLIPIMAVDSRYASITSSSGTTTAGDSAKQPGEEGADRELDTVYFPGATAADHVAFATNWAMGEITGIGAAAVTGPGAASATNASSSAGAATAGGAGGGHGGAGAGSYVTKGQLELHWPRLLEAAFTPVVSLSAARPRQALAGRMARARPPPAMPRALRLQLRRAPGASPLGGGPGGDGDGALSPEQAEAVAAGLALPAAAAVGAPGNLFHTGSVPMDDDTAGLLRRQPYRWAAPEVFLKHLEQVWGHYARDEVR